MDPGANLEAELRDALDDLAGARDRPSRPVEAREEPVARDVELTAAEAGQIGADDLMMLLEQLTPATIAQLCP